MIDSATPRRFDAVVFDFFGTLTLPVTHATQVEAVSPIAGLMGVATEDLMTVLASSFNDRCLGRWGSFEETMRHLAQAVGFEPSAPELEEICRVRLDAQRTHLVRVRGGAEQVLAALGVDGLRVGLVSDCTHDLVMIWPELELSSHIESPVFSVDVGAKKPDPALYLAAAERLGVEPERCLYVGDGGSNELTGAAAVGMTPVLLDDPVGRTAIVYDRDRWDGATIGSLDEVLRLVAGD